jgi:hypothetical protein
MATIMCKLLALLVYFDKKIFLRREAVNFILTLRVFLFEIYVESV